MSPRKKRVETTDTAHDGRSKVERYGWDALSARGELVEVDKAVLKVNHAYQRELREGTVIAISRSFSWPAFGALIVFRSGADLWIVDGQNRHAAAMRRSDVTKVPCIVFESEGAASEAKTFLAVNQQRRMVTALEKHRASLLAGDPTSATVQRMVDAAGLVLSDNPGARNFRCVASLVRLLEAKATVSATERIWPVLASARAKHDATGAKLTDHVLQAAVYIETHLVDGQSLSHPKWRARVESIGLEELHAAAMRASALYGVGGAKVWAKGVIDRLNKGLRERLAMRGEA